MKRSKICNLCAAAVVLCAVPLFAHGPDEPADEAESKWDVGDPPGEWRTITVDTTETTWSNVDVSPDGSSIVFDMLGDLYTAPISGGEAKALTSGIAWDFQPRYSP